MVYIILSCFLDDTTGSNVGGMVTTSAQILAALNDSCSKCSASAETEGETSTLLTIGGLMSIVNTALIVVVLIILLVMSICFFTCRSKEYKVDSRELTSKYYQKINRPQRDCYFEIIFLWIHIQMLS